MGMIPGRKSDFRKDGDEMEGLKVSLEAGSGVTDSLADLKRLSMSSEGFQIRGTPCSSYRNLSSKLVINIHGREGRYCSLRRRRR